MRTEFGPKEPPNAKEIAQMWRELTITHVEMKHAAIDSLLEQLRKAHSNGGAEFACFTISNHPALNWFVSRNRFVSEGSAEENNLDFFSTLLVREEVNAALPMFMTGNKLSEPLNLKWESPFTLDGQIAETLAYRCAAKKSGAEYKQIGRNFCDAVFEDRYKDILLYSSFSRWCPWFKPEPVYDFTWFAFDKSFYRCWILAVTNEPKHVMRMI